MTILQIIFMFTIIDNKLYNLIIQLVKLHFNLCLRYMAVRKKENPYL